MPLQTPFSPLAIVTAGGPPRPPPRAGRRVARSAQAPRIGHQAAVDVAADGDGRGLRRQHSERHASVGFDLRRDHDRPAAAAAPAAAGAAGACGVVAGGGGGGVCCGTWATVIMPQKMKREIVGRGSHQLLSSYSDRP